MRPTPTEILDLVDLCYWERILHYEFKQHGSHADCTGLWATIPSPLSGAQVVACETAAPGFCLWFRDAVPPADCKTLLDKATCTFAKQLQFSNAHPDKGSEKSPGIKEEGEEKENKKPTYPASSLILEASLNYHGCEKELRKHIFGGKTGFHYVQVLDNQVAVDTANYSSATREKWVRVDWQKNITGQCSANIPEPKW